MAANADVFVQWTFLLLNVCYYSFITTSLVLVAALAVYALAKATMDIVIMKSFLWVVAVSCFGAGLAAYIIGILSSLSRESGNPALIGAVLPLIGGLAIYFRDRSLHIGIGLSVLYMVFIVNVFGGVYLGGYLRHNATESLGALRERAVVEHKLSIFKKNLESLNPFSEQPSQRP